MVTTWALSSSFCLFVLHIASHLSSEAAAAVAGSVGTLSSTPPLVRPDQGAQSFGGTERDAASMPMQLDVEAAAQQAQQLLTLLLLCLEAHMEAVR